MIFMYMPHSWKYYVVGIKFGGKVPNHLCKNIGRYKFGGSERDR